MLTREDIAVLSLSQVISSCKSESTRFFKNKTSDPRYCFELFRRAILNKDDLAWQAIYSQYLHIVTHWVQICPTFSVTRELVDYFINRAFDKFWTAMTSEKFTGFSDLSSILSYLKTCVYSVVTDYARAKELANYDAAVQFGDLQSIVVDEAAENTALQRVFKEQLWQLVQERLNGEREYTVMHGSYILGLKPREIRREYRSLFTDAKEISQVKSNVLTRLRRDTAFLNLLRNA